MVDGERPADVAERIRHLRERLGLTQIQFASLLGVSNVTVNRWERGRGRPNAATWRRIERAESEGSAALVSEPTAGLLTRRGNLPRPLTSFVGRTREILELRHRLSKARLVTLAGPGGCGKTRLAIALAETVRAGYPDGVWMVDLASLGGAAV